ncbi:glycosyltransferase family 4 protein [Bacteroides sp. An322]|uniref:glycosyltransferase family 4 protein n=1 Tax=Bacteroides sp. An322 TaxID=1965632 RepID=UPI000B381914|nr:glycosyltransferase family 4 protein [Bacteroides sp. An322]OUO19571.1 hypothetical protein B5F91_07975 [Bacteroides sp. An322]
MRIAIITSPFGSLPPKGIGAVEKLWYYLGKEFCQKGNIVTFYSKDNDSYYDDKNLVICKLKGYQRTGSLKKDIIKDFFYSLRALVKLKNCDILILNTFWTPILCILFKWKYKKCIYNVARFPKGQFKFYCFVNQFSCVSLAVSRALAYELGKNDRIVMVNNPVELKDFKFTPEKEGCKFIIMYHGRVHPEKGLHLLFAAVNELYNKYSNLQLKIVGATNIEDGGGGEKYVEKLKNIAPLVPIEWINAINDPKKIALELASCNLYCYPSIADQGETFGVAPLEAMAIGRTVIVSNLECFKDFIEDGKSGFIFDHHSKNSVQELSLIIEDLINNSQLRQLVGKNASEKAKQFSVEAIASQYLNNFNQILNVD